MTTVKKIAMSLRVLLACLGGDQVPKSLAGHTLVHARTLRFFGDTLRHQHAKNTGGCLTLGATGPAHLWTGILTGSVGGVLLDLLLYLIIASRLPQATMRPA
jgi:hypothetical protein